MSIIQNTHGAAFNTHKEFKNQTTPIFGKSGSGFKGILKERENELKDIGEDGYLKKYQINSK